MWIGSLKRQNPKNLAGPFTKKDKGQLVDHLRILILRQKRYFGVGYLTDGHRIQFFKLTITDDTLSLRSTDLMFLPKDGGKVLSQFLMSKDLSLFGFSMPTILWKQQVIPNSNPTPKS